MRCHIRTINSYDLIHPMRMKWTNKVSASFRGLDRAGKLLPKRLGEITFVVAQTKTNNRACFHRFPVDQIIKTIIHFTFSLVELLNLGRRDLHKNKITKIMANDTMPAQKEGESIGK